MSWTEWTQNYTEADVKAFGNASLINDHFGIPYSNVSSPALNANGLANIHDESKKGRTNYFANLLAHRYIKTCWADAWIWDEHYRFSGVPSQKNMVHSQQEFLRLFGVSAAEDIAEAARSAGLDPGKKTAGRPDLAVYFPSEDVKWRFIEMKLPGRKDGLRKDQQKWLNFLASQLGPESAVVLEWTMAKT